MAESIVWPCNFVKPHVPRSSFCLVFGGGRNMVRVTKRQYRRDLGPAKEVRSVPSLTMTTTKEATRG